MASRRPVIKSRTMGATSTSTATMGPTAHTQANKAPSSLYDDKYNKTRPSLLSSSLCDRVWSYKHSFVFLCLCLWGLSVLIFVVVTLKSNASNSSILPRNIHRNTQLQDGEPPWKNPIQPWEILPRPPKGTPPPMKCTWEGPFDGFLAGCANDNCRNHDNLEAAQELCAKDELCTGLIKAAPNREMYQLRSGGKISDSPSGEKSYRKSCVVDEEKLSAMQQEQDAQQQQKRNDNNSKVKDTAKDKEKEKDKDKLMDRLEHVGGTNAINHDLIPDSQHSIQHQDLHIESESENQVAENRRNAEISENDPWYEWIPEIAKHASSSLSNAKQRHVYDDSHMYSGYQRPFGVDANSAQAMHAPLNLDQKVATLKHELIDPNTQCFLEGPLNGFIANCAEDNCENHQHLDTAIDKCLEQTQCTGVVQIVKGQSIYQLRSDKKLRDSPRGEQTWVKLCGEKAVQRIQEIAAETPPPKCYPYGPIKGFLGNCAGTECLRFYYFNDAMVECEAMGKSKCVGITRIPGLKKSFELRAIPPVISSESGEYSYLLECGDGGGDADDGDDGDGDDDNEEEKEREVRVPVMDLMDDALLDEYDKLGSILEIDDHHTNERVRLPSIYIGIASYRDPWCYKSVHTAFARARYPERVFVGVVQQNADDDPDCITPQVPCDEDPTQVLCKYVDHIRVKKFHAKEAAGPTFGRHHADTMYGGEYFAVQVDAHMSFIKDWDMVSIEQWRSLDNEYAVLSTYPSEIKSGLDEYGNPMSESAPIICDTRLLRNGMFVMSVVGHVYLRCSCDINYWLTINVHKH